MDLLAAGLSPAELKFINQVIDFKNSHTAYQNTPHWKNTLPRIKRGKAFSIIGSLSPYSSPHHNPTSLLHLLHFKTHSQVTLKRKKKKKKKPFLSSSPNKQVLGSKRLVSYGPALNRKQTVRHAASASLCKAPASIRCPLPKRICF